MKWYEIKNAKEDLAEIFIYDEIGGGGFWDDPGVTAKSFMQELKAIKASKIDLHINSPGGNVFEGTAIFNAIKNHPATVTSYIDGLAASIASVVALAGDTVVMAENALWMMHEPSGITMGTSADMRKMAEALDKVRDALVISYTAKSGKSDNAIIALLEAETWYTAAEAEAAGFVDRVGGKVEMAACAKFVPIMAQMQFKHIPRAIRAEAGVPAEDDLERALRDVGCTHKQAKSILAKGYSDALRDVAPPDAPPVDTPPRDVEPLPAAPKGSSHELMIRTARMVGSTT